MKEKVSNIVLGVVLIALGVVAAGNAINIWDISLLFEGWWTLFIIIPCGYSLIRGPHFTNIVGLIIGVLLLLGAQDIVDFELVAQLILPIALVGLGLSIIFAGKFGKNGRTCRNLGKGGMYEYTAIFGGRTDVIGGEEPFRGANLVSVFGGVELDLREALITEDIVINVTAVFGGVDIFCPSSVKVRTNITGIFGGADDKSKPAGTPENTVFIDGVCIFGGADIT